MPSLVVHGRVADLNERDFMAQIGSLADAYYALAERCYTRHLEGWWSDLLHLSRAGGMRDLARQAQAQITDDELASAFMSLVDSVHQMGVIDGEIIEWLAQFAGVPRVRRRQDLVRLQQRFDEIQNQGIGWWDWAALPGYQALLTKSEEAIAAATAAKESVKTRLHRLLHLQEGGETTEGSQSSISQGMPDQTDYHEGPTAVPYKGAEEGCGERAGQDYIEAISTLTGYLGVLGWVEYLTERQSRDMELCHQTHCDGSWGDLTIDARTRRIVQALVAQLEDRELRNALQSFQHAVQTMTAVDEQIFQLLKSFVALPPLRDDWDRARLRYRLKAIDATDASARESRVRRLEYQALLAESESALAAASTARQRVMERLRTVMPQTK